MLLNYFCDRFLDLFRFDFVDFFRFLDFLDFLDRREDALLERVND